MSCPHQLCAPATLLKQDWCSLQLLDKNTALAAVHVTCRVLLPPAAAAAAAAAIPCLGCFDSLRAVQLSTLIGELASAGEAELGVQLDDGVLERLLAYSRSVASFPTAVKEVSQLQDVKHDNLEFIPSMRWLDQVVARC